MVMRLLAHTYMGKRWGGGVSINREGGSRARKGGREVSGETGGTGALYCPCGPHQ